MKKYTLTVLFALLAAGAFALVAPNAYALKVRCTDPQPANGGATAKTVETIRYKGDKAVSREVTTFDYGGRQVIAPNVKERGDEYAPKPIKQGSNLHECFN